MSDALPNHHICNAITDVNTNANVNVNGNAKVQMNLRLNAMITKYDKFMLCKNVKEVMVMIKKLDDASTQYRRNTGEAPTSAKLK